MKIICEAFILKTVFTAVDHFEGDMILAFDHAGVSSVIWSLSGTAMTEIQLSKDIFKEYKLSAEDEELIGLDISLMNKSLKRIDKNTDISLEVVENKLLIETIGDTKKRFKIPLIETDTILENFKEKMWSDATEEKREEVAEQIKTRYFPKIDFEAILETNTHFLQTALDDIGVLFSSKEAPYTKIWVTLVNGVFSMHNYDEHWGVAESEIPFEEIKNKEKGFKNIYNFQKLQDAINTSISDKATLQTGKHLPMQIHYSLGDTDSHIAHLFAPIIEDAEDLKKKEGETSEG